MTGAETSAALRRAARRAAFHLLRAGLEGIRAVEALVDELSKVGRQDGPDDCDDPPGRVRIDIE